RSADILFSPGSVCPGPHPAPYFDATICRGRTSADAISRVRSATLPFIFVIGFMVSPRVQVHVRYSDLSHRNPTSGQVDADALSVAATSIPAAVDPIRIAHLRLPIVKAHKKSFD